MFVSQNEENNLGRNPETTLFEQPQAGCAESLNKLMIRHERLVHWVARRQQFSAGQLSPAGMPLSG